MAMNVSSILNTGRMMATVLLGSMILLVPCEKGIAETSSNSQETLRFNRDIRPILSRHCFNCHGLDVKKRKADLRLDIPDGAFASSEGQQAILPGKPAESVAWLRIISTDDEERMPPPESHQGMSADEKAIFKRWIQQGAPYESHWSFIAPTKPSVPGVDHMNYPVDAFINARLKEAGLLPSGPADKETLIRRVTLDLTGLPPTPEEVDTFLEDTSPTAYDSLVDGLMHRATYGEHMARQWLDLARYADTHGLHLDNERSMWPYRDWVVRAFNANLPFDTFTLWQLAGDLLPQPNREQRIASGFNRCNVSTGEGGSITEEWVFRNAVDRTNTSVEVWMGLTAGCATCHDHKFDPLTIKEYYSMYAFFHSAADPALDGNKKDTPPVLRLSTPEQERQLNEVEEKIKVVQSRITDITAEEEKKKLEAQKKTLQDKKKSLLSQIPLTFVMADLPKPRESFVMERGAYDRPGARVTRNVPAFLPPLPEKPSERDYNRLDLAHWLVSGEHPLTGRVVVNRIWQQFFGTGLVASSGDFGTQGSLPSHPELLDWLSVQLVEDGWNIQRMIKRVVRSDAYRRHSRGTPEMLREDPDNRLMARGPRLRLDAEVVRDQALFVSGLLTSKLGGKGVFPYQPPNIWEPVAFGGSNTRHYKQGTGRDLYRRSLYTFFKRTAPPPFMATFDAPNREQSCSLRGRSNTPLQALQLMNDIQHVEAARHLAARAFLEGGDSDEARLSWMWRVMTARHPDSEELQTILGTLQQHRHRYLGNPEAAKALVSYGETPSVRDKDAVEMAAHTLIANLLLNLDESVNKN